MQVLPIADISDRRHLVPEHSLGAKHLVLSNSSDQARVERDAKYALRGNVQVG